MDRMKSAWERALERSERSLQQAARPEAGLENRQWIIVGENLAQRLLEGDPELQRLPAVLERYEPGPRAVIAQAMSRKLVAGLNLANYTQLIPSLQQLLTGEQGSQMSRELLSLGDDYCRRKQAAQAELQQAADQQGRLRLLAKGISGTAIAGINLQVQPQWRQLEAQLEAEFHQIANQFDFT